MVGSARAVPVGTEFPAVIRAADAVLFVAAEEEIGAAMRATGGDETDFPVSGAEGAQVFAEDRDSDRRTVGFGQFGAEQHRVPEASEQIAHWRFGAGAREKNVVGF